MRMYTKSIKYNFAKSLKAAREKAGITQLQLSQKSGINSMEISHYECGRRKPGVENLILLRRAIGCKFDDLLES